MQRSKQRIQAEEEADQSRAVHENEITEEMKNAQYVKKSILCYYQKRILTYCFYFIGLTPTILLFFVVTLLS